MEQTNKIVKSQRKQSNRKPRLIGDDRIIDLLERIGATLLYVSTPLGQNEVSKILGMDNNRTNEVLKGVKKTNEKR